MGEPQVSREADVRCQRCGLVMSGVSEKKIRCHRCGLTIDVTENPYRNNKSRLENEVVLCPYCGRMNENVTTSSIKCELCGKLLDVAANRLVPPRRLNTSAFELGILILLVGLLAMGGTGVVTIVRFGSLSYLAVLKCGGIFLWLAAFPLLWHLARRTTHNK
ncbi:MAG: hypothetical protein PVH19_04265 [Planctomycetia bacterium]|jgi:tRNA(Ile2) C34 agmatinyltransferase TiaS